MPPSDWFVARLWVVFLIDSCGWVGPSVGGTIPRQVVLGGIRKQDESATESEPQSSMVSASVPVLTSLYDEPVRQMAPFLSKLPLVRVLYYINRETKLAF